MNELQKDNAEKGLRESVWLAIYFADQLKLDALGMRLLQIRKDLLSIEISK